jgi:DNA-directed RNA polymerase subunit RPC12/RpoP
MSAPYTCADCGRAFEIALTADEQRSYLDPDRTDACPGCGCRVGWGRVVCRACGTIMTLRLPHWHVQCDTGSARCPRCGTEHRGWCVC